MASLIALAKAQPSKLNYGSAGAATPHHIAMELFRQKAGLNITHVPYKGEAPAVQDLLGGNIDLMFASANSAVAHHASGRLRILGSSGNLRSPRLPDIQTLHEQGLTGYNYSVWHAVVAPASTPASIVAKLNGAFVQASRSPEVTNWIAANTAASVISGSATSLKELIATDYLKYRDVVKMANIVAS